MEVEKTIKVGDVYMDVDIYQHPNSSSFGFDIYVKTKRDQPQNWGWDIGSDQKDLVTGSGSIRCLVAAAKIARGWANKHHKPLFIIPADRGRESAYRRIEKYGATPFTEIDFSNNKVCFKRTAWVFN